MEKNKQKEKKEENIDWLSESVKVVNRNPNKLNEEGKRTLASDLIDEIPLKDVEEFIKKHGYNKEL